MVCSLIKNSLEPAVRFEHILKTYRKMAGGKSLGYSKNVFQVSVLFIQFLNGEN